MKPGPCAYARAGSVEEAVALLAEHGDEAKVLAGGQSLVPMLSLRLARPALLVDIGPIEGLRYVRRDGGGLAVGALTPHRRIERAAGEAALAGFEVLPRAARLIGHHPIRTRGTVGGSLAHADPSAEWCVLAVLLDAEVTAVGPQGARTILAADLLEDYFTTSLRPDEVLTQVWFPRPAPHAALVEWAPRHGDFGLVLAGARADLDGGVLRRPRVVLGGVGGAPIRAREAEAVLDGRPPTPAVFRAAARAAADACDPPSDVHASAAYRRRLAAVLVRGALCEAVGATTGEGS